jgi:hypothetical protein
MTAIRIFLSALLVLSISTAALAQQKNYALSEPVDIRETGLNKVLCLRNGNTMLLHFEPTKAVTVKIFDSTHREIASQKHICRYLDINLLYNAVFKGLYDISGEGVLFVEQQHLSRKQLVRVRFNAVNGNIIEEKIMGEAPNISTEISFSVMKNKGSDDYHILFASDVLQFKQCDIYIACYNGKHEEIRKVPITIDRKNYDYVQVVGAESQPAGNCITLDLIKMVTNRTIHSGEVSDNVATYDHTLFIAYNPANTTTVLTKEADMSTTSFPCYTQFNYNPFAQSLNVLLFNNKEFLKKNGLDAQPMALQSSLLFTLDETNMAFKYNWIKNNMANVYYQRQTDTTRLFSGIPVQMFTNNNGLCTIISQQRDIYDMEETRAKPLVRESYFEKVGITQCDDEGKELWGVVLPFAQYYKSYDRHYSAYEMAKRWQNQQMFGDMPPQVYNRQFVSLNAYNYKDNFFLIYNDNDGNFNNSVTHPGDTVYNFERTNACYYKLNRKKEVTKHYLFDTPAENEYKTSFIEGAYFDDRTGVYASLVQCNKDDKITLCMAWCRLD